MQSNCIVSAKKSGLTNGNARIPPRRLFLDEEKLCPKTFSTKATTRGIEIYKALFLEQILKCIRLFPW